MATTRREFLVASGILTAIFPTVSLAADSWLKKKPEEWSAEDIDTILNHSAWVKSVEPEFSGGLGSFPGGGPPDGGGFGGGFPPGGGGPGGGGGMPDFEALIRWESALPVRTASKSALPEVEGQPHYVVSMSGLPFGGPMPPAGGEGRGRGGPQGGAPGGSQDPASRTQQLLQTSSLQRKGKDPIAPDHAEFMDDDSDSVILLYFPADRQPIQLADKEVVFSSRVGPLTIKAKFTLKDMMYQGKLEL